MEAVLDVFPYSKLQFADGKHGLLRVEILQSWRPRIFGFGHSKSDSAKSVIVGGSTCFGVGANGDENTIPSLLSLKANHCFLNLGGRAFSSTQELILFISLIEKLRRVERVVIFSGLNDLFLAHLDDAPDEMLGSFYFAKQFNKVMDENIITARRRLARLLFAPLLREGFDFARASRSDFFNAIWSIGRPPIEDGYRRPGRAPFGYRCLADQEKPCRMESAVRGKSNFKIVFALQPTAQWSDRVPLPKNARCLNIWMVFRFQLGKS